MSPRAIDWMNGAFMPTDSRAFPADVGLRAVAPAPRTEWRKAFDADPSSQAFHSPEWVDGVCAAGGFEDVTRMYETHDGRGLVVPMVRRSYLGGVLSVQGSLPLGWGIGGVISGDPIRPTDLSAIYADLRGQPGVLRTFIGPAARSGATWAAADLPRAKTAPRLCHVLDLDGGFGTVWSKRFTSTARTAVRKADKSGVVVELDTTGARLPEYFTLVESSMKRWARQQHEPLLLSRLRTRRRASMARLQALAAAVPTRFRLYLAMLDGRAVAGIIVYRGNGTRYTSGAMIKELAGPVRANYLLHRTAIEDACDAGSTHFDFGESGASPGLAVYKTRFGARPEPYQNYVIERLPLTELDRSLRQAVKRVIGFREPADPEREGPGSGTAD